MFKKDVIDQRFEHYDLVYDLDSDKLFLIEKTLFYNKLLLYLTYCY